MRILLVEPLGHMGGHPSEHTKHLVRTPAHAGVDITLLTFNGLLGDFTETGANVKCVSFFAKHGTLARLVQFLPHLFPSKIARTLLEWWLCTYCTLFEALQQQRKGKYDVIHILDAGTPDYDFPWFASVVDRCSLVFTLFAGSREADIENWWAKLKATLSKRQITMGLQLCSRRLWGTRLTTALREFLYRRGAKRNRQAFICYTSTVRDSYSGSPFYNRITRMFRGTELPEAQPLTKGEAREHLGLSQNGIMLLHFGVTHLLKNLEVIFEALRDLRSDYRLVFAGRVELVRPAYNLWKLAQKYDLQQSTLIVDRYLTDEEAKYYFYAVDAVILSHRKDFKGASGVLSTAAQYSLPVIAADVGDTGEVVKRCKLGLTFEAEDPQSLREAILSFLNLNEEKKHEIKRNLSCFAQTHSWQEVAQRHVKLYQGLIEGKSALI